MSSNCCHQKQQNVYTAPKIVMKFDFIFLASGLPLFPYSYLEKPMRSKDTTFRKNELGDDRISTVVDSKENEFTNWLEKELEKLENQYVDFVTKTSFKGSIGR